MPHVGNLFLLLLLLVHSSSLAVWSSQVKKSLEQPWEEKNMPMAETLLLCFDERVKEATAHTAQRLAACSTSSSWLLYRLIQPLLQTRHFWNHTPSVELREDKYFGQLFFRAPRQRAGSRTAFSTKHVSELHCCCFCFFFSIFCTALIWHQPLSHYSPPNLWQQTLSLFWLSSVMVLQLYRDSWVYFGFKTWLACDELEY